jgi:hypothetical protein
MLLPPTWTTLTELSEFATAAEALAAGRSLDPIIPKLIREGDKVRVVLEPQ